MCAEPSSIKVAKDMFSTALSLTLHARSRRMPLLAERVFHPSTADAWLATISEASRHPRGSHCRALSAGIDAALDGRLPTRAVSGSADTGDDLGEAAEGATTLAPLLMTASAPSRQTISAAGLDSAAGRDLMATLHLIRAQVLSVEPHAMRVEERAAGKGRAVPYGDVEVAALLAAAATQRSTKRRLHVGAAVALGLGAGVTGERASAVRGTDITHRDGILTVATSKGTAIVHDAFADTLTTAAGHAAHGWVLGGGNGRVLRMSQLAVGLAGTDPRLVRLNSARLWATWLAVHATRGVPLRDLLTASGLTSTTAFDQVMPYLPPTTARGAVLLAGRTGDEPASTTTAVAS